MDNLKEIFFFLYKFAERHGLKEVQNINDGFNLQLIFAYNDLKIEFVRDRGEFFIYFKFCKLPTKRDLYSLSIIAEILSNEKIRDTDYIDMLNYLEKNLFLIYELFEKDKEIDKKYDVEYNKLFNW